MTGNPTTIAVDAVESGMRCAACDYNLTGAPGIRCPECGWLIDWAMARSHVEHARLGTPAQRAHGWRVIDQTLFTVVMMLLTPWIFARRIRADEPLLPSVLVALASVVLLHAHIVGFRPHDLSLTWLVCLGAAIVVVLQMINFGALHALNTAPRVTFGTALRLWLRISLYSSCFVVAWHAVDGPPAVFAWNETNFYWPLNRSGLVAQAGTSIIFYWWWLILAISLVVRSRPRWRGAIGIPLVFLHAWLATWLVVLLE